jgi:putative Mn2+ efflux pump MntP
MITILLIAVGLAMDAFAISIASGITIRDPKVSNALTIALFFGTFQTFMQ